MINKPKYLGTPEYNTVCEQLKVNARQKGKPTGYNFIFTAMKLTPGNHAAKEAGQMLGEIIVVYYK